MSHTLWVGLNSRTSLVAQTARHATVAEVAQEAVARARLIPVDVRLVMAKEVTGDGVVPGFHRSAEERIGRDYDPARDGGGTGGDVARDLVARKLHAPGAENRDADPREICPPLCGSTRARVVLDCVAFHLEVIYGVRRSSFEEHAPAGVVDRVSGEEAAVGVDDGDAPRGARDVVANDLGVAGTALDIDAWGVGYNMVLRHSGVDAPESEDRATNIAYETVSYNSSALVFDVQPGSLADAAGFQSGDIILYVGKSESRVVFPVQGLENMKDILDRYQPGSRAEFIIKSWYFHTGWRKGTLDGRIGN